MELAFEVVDKTGRRIYLSKERYRHVLRHPHMYEHIESIKNIIKNPLMIRYFEEDEKVRYFYGYFKDMNISERYLLVSVKYLNGKGFVITSFFTDKMTGIKWKEK